MNVLVACEASQAVCTAFREKGATAFSCDIQDCYGGHPEWHIKADVTSLINGFCGFLTQDGTSHVVSKWDLIIAHPPCTYLTVSGNRWLNQDRYGEKARQRAELQKQAIDFFMLFANADCDKIAIENPVGKMSNVYRKPDQIIQPWQFGDNYSKRTCLWLKGLKPLMPQVNTPPEMEWHEWRDKTTGKIKRQAKWDIDTFHGAKTAQERQRIRSKTFQGIANAMADQWYEREENK